MEQVVTLLLHQQCVAEALAQFRAHIGAFRQPPLPPPPAAAATHAAWLVRQYTVMGELLSQRVDAGLLPPQVRGVGQSTISAIQDLQGVSLGDT